MTHLSPFHGIVGFATLHPLFAFGPLVLASVWGVIAARKKPTANPERRGR